ncbi:MAG: hypothetical protein KDB07_12790, partial [Planctomycetes bacterium]|nr:hypothetical protein [Planctomycetota bacterium]
ALRLGRAFFCPTPILTGHLSALLGKDAFGRRLGIVERNEDMKKGFVVLALALMALCFADNVKAQKFDGLRITELGLDISTIGGGDPF